MIYELVIEDENVDEVFAISLVEEPALESNYLVPRRKKSFKKFKPANFQANYLFIQYLMQVKC